MVCEDGTASKGNAAIDRARATRARTLWTQLNTVDFINTAFLIATYALLCVFLFSLSSPQPLEETSGK